MSDFFDALVPPRKSDYALTPHDESAELVDEDNLVPDKYTYDTQLLTWVCLTCGAAVGNTDLHTEWHDQLLGSLDKDDTPR